MGFGLLEPENWEFGAANELLEPENEEFGTGNEAPGLENQEFGTGNELLELENAQVMCECPSGKSQQSSGCSWRAQG